MRAAWTGSVLSLLIGLAFVFVRAPHPWGWEGLDEYRDLGLALARGEAYPTLERVWGYPFYLAVWYYLFGDRQWIPLVIQVLLNATLPLLVFALARRQFDSRTAGVAALLTGVISFNTVYASTQAADALCTVAFVTGLLCFAHGDERRSTSWFAASGTLFGIALLLRPNLLLFPLVLAVMHLTWSNRGRQWPRLAAFMLAVLVVWAPWPVRNYRIAHRFIPATTHGGMQLWYGSLQVSPYFERKFESPRAQLEFSPFDYSRPDGRPIEVEVTPATDANRPDSVSLVYWTNRVSAPAVIDAAATPAATWRFAIPPQPDRTVVYFHLLVRTTGTPERAFPAAGRRNPLRHFVSDNHVGDLDFDAGLVDIFDLVRLAHPADGSAGRGLDLDGDGRSTRADLTIAAGTLVVPEAKTREPDLNALRAVDSVGSQVRFVMADGSSVTAPALLERMTDLTIAGSAASLAANMVRSARSLASLRLPPEDLPELLAPETATRFRVRINKVFPKSELYWMDRYNALAFDNIARDPSGFAVASAKRLLRLFVILGSDDSARAYQFSMSGLIYLAGTVASVTLLGLSGAGAVIAWRRGTHLALLLVPVLYVPATIFPFLTNMRYSLTVQPLMLILVAVALVAIADRFTPGRRERKPAGRV